jgi:hypothetical protein
MTVPERDELRNRLRQVFEQTFEERVDREQSVPRERLIPNHHFAFASSECLDLFRDGYFLSCIMVCQAVSEGLGKLVMERNQVCREQKETVQNVLNKLQLGGEISQAFVERYSRIYGRFRNDFHHMNPRVAGLPYEALARGCVDALVAMEAEVFAQVVVDGGRLEPLHPKYWDIKSDGSTMVYVR